VIMSPPDLGKVIFTYDSNLEGIEIDSDVLANASEVGVMIQVPKDSLHSVFVERRNPFFVNILDGFTQLRYVSIEGGHYCDQFDDGCWMPFACGNNLFTSKEVKDIGPTVFADLRSVQTKVPFGSIEYKMPISVSSWGGVLDLTVVLPPKEDGVDVNLNFSGGQSKIKINGNITCDDKNDGNDSSLDGRNSCYLEGDYVPGCKDCSSELFIDGSISGYFNMSATRSADTDVRVKANLSQGGGCDHLAWEVPSYVSGAAGAESLKCSDGVAAGAVIDVTPLPCISSNVGSLTCGTNQYDACFCRVDSPISGRSCPAQTSSAPSLAGVTFSLVLAFVAAGNLLW